MEAHARAPDPLSNVGNMANNWQSWKEDFIIFMKVTGYINKPNEVRANLLKNRIGKVGINAIQNMSFDNPQDKDDMDILLTKLEEIFNPPKQEVIERYQFFTRSKKQNESIEQYINSLREKAKTCNFREMADSIIRDKVILDTHDKVLRNLFFEADNLNLQKLITIYNNYQVNTENMKQLTKENQVKSTHQGNSTQKPKQHIKENQVQSENSTQKPATNAKKGGGSCWRCGRAHPLGKCPAWGSNCTKCGETNHFTQCCRSSKSNVKTNNDKVNKNLLDPQFVKSHAKDIAKSNEKLWNNRVDSMTTPNSSTKDSMNKMTSLPDIPTSCGAANSVYDRPDFTFSNNPSTHHNNTMGQSTYLPKNSQSSNLDMSKVIPGSWKMYYGSTSQKPKDNLTTTTFKNISYNVPKLKQNRNKKDEECSLS